MFSASKNKLNSLDSVILHYLTKGAHSTCSIANGDFIRNLNEVKVMY